MKYSPYMYTEYIFYDSKRIHNLDMYKPEYSILQLWSVPCTIKTYMLIRKVLIPFCCILYCLHNHMDDLKNTYHISVDFVVLICIVSRYLYSLSDAYIFECVCHHCDKAVYVWYVFYLCASYSGAISISASIFLFVVSCHSRSIYKTAYGW